MMESMETKVRSLLLAVKNKRVSLDEAQATIVAMVEERENLVFDSVKLVVTELEREVRWLKERRD